MYSLKTEIIATTKLSWVEFCNNPRVLLEICKPNFNIGFDPIVVSVDPTSEYWCVQLLGAQDGFIGFVGYTPPELPVFFLATYTDSWHFHVPTSNNFFNKKLKLPYGVDIEADLLENPSMQFPDVRKLELTVRRYLKSSGKLI
jgi:hypothetical protein